MLMSLKRIRYSPTTAPQVMDSSTTTAVYSVESFSFSFSKFNSALTVGLLNLMSPPPPPSDKAQSSSTLFKMMASKPDSIPRS
ncbi:BTB/POZ domain-containing protein [Camellia lanceoleosa]|uniref:BTB/POZ domain-containing protein n=1 Tax=Camellia lanceoleosa TaxID=1840588 RepID=A0ACC0GB61_9ERIC|nr:BTB/POZ domain-containing protein [Camellia lanceoleosa]